MQLLSFQAKTRSSASQKRHGPWKWKCTEELLDAPLADMSYVRCIKVFEFASKMYAVGNYVEKVFAARGFDFGTECFDTNCKI